MLVNLFPTPVYKIRLDNHDEVQSEFNKVLFQDEHFVKIPTWYSSVDTTYGNRKADILPWHVFIKSAVKGLDEYLKHLGVNSKGDIRIECWLNRYSKGHAQEIHNHVGEAIVSCAYMMKIPADSGKFVFYKNAYNDLNQSSLPKLCSDPFRFNNRVTPPLEEGDIVYFPSSLDHYVTENTSDQVRATISANFIIKENNGQENN